MAIKKLTIVFILLLINAKTTAQEINSRLDINNSYITFNALSAFAFTSLRYTVGFVTPVHRRWMVGLDVGYSDTNLIPNYFDESIVIGNDYRLFEIRSKAYFRFKPALRAQPYVSAELFYINHRDHFDNTTDRLKGERYIRMEEDSQMNSLSYDSADYLRQKTGLNINFGMFLTLIQNIGINIDAGLGIRNRNLNYTNVLNPELFSPPNDDGYPSMTQFVIGNKIGANLSINFKLFYRLERISNFLPNKNKTISQNYSYTLVEPEINPTLKSTTVSKE